MLLDKVANLYLATIFDFIGRFGFVIKVHFASGSLQSNVISNKSHTSNMSNYPILPQRAIIVH